MPEVDISLKENSWLGLTKVEEVEGTIRSLMVNQAPYFNKAADILHAPN